MAYSLAGIAFCKAVRVHVRAHELKVLKVHARAHCLDPFKVLVGVAKGPTQPALF
jgi:hypothetical protein